ncbi:MAG TPA: DNA-processing protein DprA [Acidimicrobiales bacterium]|nr:DNA-processing protein DprA [Acidimicrobiales bacterium]
MAKLLDGVPPGRAWQAVLRGTHSADPRRGFTASARLTDVGQVAGTYDSLGVEILLPGTARYPSGLEADPGAPAVLFAAGDPTRMEGRPRVAIVGTRSATHYGLQVASELGADLASEGVVVVSGLAAGIDGAAHAGVLRGAGASAAPPVAVVGTGLDQVYPKCNRDLWGEVAATGVVFSESSLGTVARPGVFPARNRIIAALSDVVVVVESHRRGGSLYTAEAAARRSIPVCAVPGSVRSPASTGTNGLLVDGCVPVRDATDVLVAISLARAGRADGPGVGAGDGMPDRERHGAKVADDGEDGRAANTRSVSRAGRRNRASDVESLALSATERAVLGSIDDTPTAFETILIRSDLSLATAAQACDRLVERGVVRAGAGWWSKS